MRDYYPEPYDIPENAWDPYADTGTALGGGLALSSLIPGLSALGPVGMGLSALSAIVSMFGARSAQRAEEERRRKQEALRRAAAMSRSFERAGWGGY